VTVCPKCGAEIPESAKFCTACGAVLAAPVPEAPVVSPVPPVPEYRADAPVPNEPVPAAVLPGYAPPAAASAGTGDRAPAAGAIRALPPDKYGYPDKDHASAAGAVKAAGGSPVFLIAVLLYTAGVAISAAGYFGPAGGLFGPGSPGGLSGAAVGYLLALVPQVLICIGLWAFFVACRGRGPVVGTAGLSLIKSGTVIYLVFVFIAAAITFFIGVFVGVLFANGGSLASLTALTDFIEQNIPWDLTIIFGIFLIVAIVALAVLILVIIYFFAVLRIINAARLAATGKPHKRVTAFVPVLNFLAAALFLISLVSSGAVLASRNGGLASVVNPYVAGRLSGFLSFLPASSSGSFGILGPLCSAGFLILVSVGIFMYKSAASRDI